jgi:hypothetical protein
MAGARMGADKEGVKGKGASGGSEQTYRDKMSSPSNWSKGGVPRMDPKKFARNNLSIGGVNKDLGGGAKSSYGPKLPAGKASMECSKK